MRVRLSMRKALADPDAFGRIMAGSSRYGWRVLLIAAAGEALNDDERETFRKLTGRDREPGQMCHEVIVTAGRRAGKTQAMTAFAAWIAIYCDHRDVLSPGETGVVLVISRDQRAAKIVLDYFEGMLRSVDPERSPLPGMIANRTAEIITLTNGINVEVRPCNRISGRGATFVAIIADEVAFWFTEVNAANPDAEILTAVRPGLLTTGGPLLMASSAYAKRGVLYDSYRKYYGPTGPPDILVAYATSRDLNPSLPQEEIDRALERDPTANRAEYLSEWRNDVEGFIPRELVEACVTDFYELPPNRGICYRCFVDAASGVPEGDSFAIAVSHKLGDRIVIDAVREAKPPFSPTEVVNTVLLPLCKAYSISSVVGDAYAGEYPRELVRAAGISYELAAKHKSQLYQDPFLSLLNSRKIDLPRHERAINQICSLERSVQRSGRDQITHPVHGHDDISNAIAGAADLAYNFTLFDPSFRWATEDDSTAAVVPQPPKRLHPTLTDEQYLRIRQPVRLYPG